MAKLSAAQRKKLPSSTFAGPNRSFPIPDKNHAKAALSMIGNAPPSARANIRAKADAKLGSKPTKPPAQAKKTTSKGRNAK